MRTHSFRVTAIGQVAKQPEVKHKGDCSYLNLCLIGNDYAGPDKPDVVTGLFFTAFGSMANALGKSVRKGDQLILDAHIRDNSFTDGTGETVRSHSFIIDGFRFGAPGREKRAVLADSNGAADGGADQSTESPEGREDLSDEVDS